MRATLKRLVESALLNLGPATISRRRRRGHGLILAYHNVVSDEHAGRGDSSLHLPVSAFRAQLLALEEHVDVVPLPLLLEPHGTEGCRRPRVALTFDDAYLGAVKLGLPEVSSRGMHATVFVSPGRLGGQSFWWDRYAREIESSEDATFRDVALRQLGGVDARVSASAEARGWTGSDLPDSFHTAHEKDLVEAVRLTGVGLGSHSWSHPNLTMLDDAELQAELHRSRSWLVERFEASIEWLAYPYGLVDDRVTTVARRAGYEAALRVEGGWILTERPDPFLVPRLNVPAGLSEAGFRCRLAGLLGGGP